MEARLPSLKALLEQTRALVCDAAPNGATIQQLRNRYGDDLGVVKERIAALQQVLELAASPAPKGNFSLVLLRMIVLFPPSHALTAINAHARPLVSAGCGFDMDAPVVVIASPGRDRLFMGHTDFAGLGGFTVDAATCNEVLAVLQLVPPTAAAAAAIAVAAGPGAARDPDAAAAPSQRRQAASDCRDGDALVELYNTDPLAYPSVKFPLRSLLAVAGKCAIVRHFVGVCFEAVSDDGFI